MPTNLLTDERAGTNPAIGRRQVRTTVASVLAALALTASLLLGSASTAQAAAAPTDFAGIGDWGYPTTAQSQRLASDGVRSVRAGLVWDWVERVQGKRAWGGIDKLASDASKGGYELVLVINGCAAWACGETRVAPSTPEAKAAFQDFVGAAVRRYGAGGEFWKSNPSLAPSRMNWQVWNEVNVGQDWPNPTVAGYAELLRTTSATIKAVDPSARVVSAGLAELPAVASGFPLSVFLEGLEQDPSFRASADVVAIHGYAESPLGVARVLDTTRRIMAKYGDTRPIWITELGWGDGGPAHPFAVDSAKQAQNLRDTYDMMVGCSARWNLSRAIWFSIQDVTPAALNEADYWGMHTGLYAVDGTEKPVAAAFREFTGGKELPGGRGATCTLPDPDAVAARTGASPAPVAAIVKSPAALIGAGGDSTVAFTATGVNSGFQCSVNGSPWSRCISPYVVPKTEGAQQISVRALDAVGQARSAPVSAAWTTDLTAPTTAFSNKPPKKLKKRSVSATFTTTSVRLAAVARETVTYQCSVTATGATSKAAKSSKAKAKSAKAAPVADVWTACSATYRAKVKSKGKYLLKVRAVDAAGNVDARGASASFTAR
ncbi:MAG: hypothetical protein Q7T55_13115 [Solirubrobacteraceae bacterium]|nr:hypothetical protein [Solirubrobacteraceae bacterium]